MIARFLKKFKDPRLGGSTIFWRELRVTIVPYVSLKA